jgi:tritrans,polycis-undecaprenyl-diphosphate synthase [geranylgeranyl-diphosphate specific]
MNLTVPEHIGVILDGNRRYAKQIMKKPWFGHKVGLEKAREVLKWSCESGIKHITAYVLSLENIASRPKAELNFILKCIGDEADNILKSKNHIVHAFNVRVRFIGSRHLLPNGLQKKMQAVEERTANYKKHVLNIAVAYGGRQELVEAMKDIMRKGLRGVITENDLDERMIREHLYTNGQPYPDLIFRTGGEKRISNFLPFQSAYSELIFTDKKWPELTHSDFKAALTEFSSRKRRFGK